MIYNFFQNLFFKKEIDLEVDIAIPSYVEDIKLNNVKEIKNCLDCNTFEIENVYNNKSKYSALSLAVVFGQLEMIKLFVSYNANVNFQDRFKVTPLMQAAGLGDQDIVEFLCMYNADPLLKDIDGMNSIDYADKYQNWEIKEYLTNLVKNNNGEQQNQFYQLFIRK